MLTDNARVVRWAGPVFVLFSLILLPWIVYLAYSLPSRQVSADHDIAWSGFEVLLLAALAGTGYFALRRSRYLATAAAGSDAARRGRLVRRHDHAAGPASRRTATSSARL